ncbi:replicative DNA helicase [Kingella negevensis]|uniref:replicative DNA helicase n=1 Tax=Kingella negevensis TaxID=1522312 RepID=UPI00050A30B4|nr:replicative DNA helicase [Kingella negevensis]MDK4680743.1 replicative DNA helicase [Kingella negevensis]MDK4681534.1 replicative DNA helicase [Kingella negevensis]MDK4687814.1 replicative DNA helicase [Kingella negevensis]MDK4691921.1 replicative DNA helicase [Kingella negevensis]MDK4692926.1 replicative DNA helicase [Kingella negevensis]
MDNFNPSQSDDSEVRSLNLPPHSIEAEQSLLGGLMLENAAWDKVADLVVETDFYRHEHRLVFRAISNLINESRPADVITVQDELKLHEQLEQAGGFDYLVTLAQTTPSAANIRRYAEIVRERSVVRQLAEVGTEIARSAFNPQGRTAEQLLDEAESKVFQIAESTEKSKQGFLEMPDLLRQNIERIDALYQRDNPSAVTGVSTGFIDLDKMTSGLQAGDLIIVAGRPSMGKTAFSINIAENIAINDKLPVAVFSMEMGAAQLVMRMLSSVGRLDQSVLKNGNLQDEHWERLNEAVAKLSDAPVFVDETPGLTALELRARARRLARRFDGKLGLIVIDYLQLMSGSGRSDNRASELGEISRSLKALAKELQVPVIALSQLSRTVEQRTDKRPMMSDLRESGAIEQDADLIMFMFRDEYYTKEQSQFKGLAECIIGKHRNGPTGRVFLTFMGQFTKFENAAYIPENVADSD